MPAAIDQTHAAVDDAAMGSVLAAKQHLRSVMKIRLSGLNHDAIMSQSGLPSCYNTHRSSTLICSRPRRL
jgi:hypothetical protein